MKPDAGISSRPKPAAAQLAAFAVESPLDSIPHALERRAGLHILDTLGCGLAAVGTGVAGHAAAIALDQAGRAEASVLGARTRLPAALAALVNGTRCHGLDFDDTHETGICHVSTVVAPAALAAGEASSRPPAEILDAYVLGSEVALRVAVAAADALYARGFHPTSVCGAFGAAAAACRLLGVSAERATSALGVVGSFAAGLLEYLSDGSATKPLHAGWAAQAGVQAARLAAAGASGPASVLDGRFGLFASHAGGAAAPVCADLGERWEFADVSIKAFPACHFAHSSTWAAGQLADEHGLRPESIAAITVRVPPEGAALVLEPPAAKARPRTSYEAKFSLPFMVAHRLVHGRLDIASFSPASIDDPDVLALAALVDSEPIDGGGAPSRFAGGVRILTRDGHELDRFVPHVPGSPQNPLNEDVVLHKFRTNAALSLNSADADALIERVREIDHAESLEPLAALLRGARTPLA